MTSARLGVEIAFTDHAEERYGERVKPTLTVAHVAAELIRLVSLGTLRLDPPPWLARRQHEEAPLYFVVAEIVFPLRASADGRLVAMTCIPPGSISEETRRRRTAARKARRRRR